MIYVVVEELIPESQSGKHTNIGTIGVVIGICDDMVLDVALGRYNFWGKKIVLDLFYGSSYNK